MAWREQCAWDAVALSGAMSDGDVPSMPRPTPGEREARVAAIAGAQIHDEITAMIHGLEVIDPLPSTRAWLEWNASARLDYLETEVPRMVTGPALGGTVDAICRDEWGDIGVMDWKTRTVPGRHRLGAFVQAAAYRDLAMRNAGTVCGWDHERHGRISWLGVALIPRDGSPVTCRRIEGAAMLTACEIWRDVRRAYFRSQSLMRFIGEK